MSNFIFLKSIDKDLYEIISDAEKLFRDEYYEQSISQARRFGENVCKKILSNTNQDFQNFDEMLATLKDKACNSVQEREFVEDLYFLKKEGNASVHSEKVLKKDLTALECLKRAFEISLNYAVHYKKADFNLMNLQYDTELLITNKKSKKTLSEKYIKAKNKTKQKKNNKNKVISVKKKKPKYFIFFLILSSIISSILILTIFLLTLIS